MSAAIPRRIKSAERTLALFELFSREQRPFTVGRIAAALGIPQPSVSMLLHNLEALGYLEYDQAARTYAPSIRVALLGSWIDRKFALAGAIGQTLGELQRATGLTAFIGIQNGSSAQYVLAQNAGSPDRLEVVSGGHRSLTVSAVGRALLSLKPDAEVRSWVRRCNAEAGEPRFRVNETAYLALMEQVRGRGWAETAGEVTPGLGAIAMTFVSPMGTAPLAVGAGGPMAQLATRREAVLAALRRFKAAFAESP